MIDDTPDGEVKYVDEFTRKHVYRVRTVVYRGSHASDPDKQVLPKVDTAK